MANTRALAPDGEQRLLALLADGHTLGHAAAALRVSYKTVSRVAARHGASPPRGHRRTASPACDPALLAQAPARYAAGETTGQIARNLGVSDQLVLTALRNAGTPRRPAGLLTERDLLRIAARYLAGEPARAIAPTYALTENSILHALRRTGTPRRDPASARRVYPLNETAFTTMTPDACYWAGFLMADGSVQPDGRMAVLLRDRDDGQLDALRRFLGSPTKPISYRTTEPGTDFGPAAGGRYCSITFDSLPLVTDLARYGVVPRKSWTALASPEAAASPDFWRGCIDGDGTLSFSAARNGYPALGLYGTRGLLAQFADLLGGCLPDGYVPVPYKMGPKAGDERHCPTLFRVSAAGTRAKAACRMLYPRGVYALARKRARADRMLAWVSPAELRSWTA